MAMAADNRVQLVAAAVVAFDVLFAAPDRISIEAIVKQLPPREASAVAAATGAAEQ
jgi:hypothetical protein